MLNISMRIQVGDLINMPNREEIMQHIQDEVSGYAKRGYFPTVALIMNIAYDWQLPITYAELVKIQLSAYEFLDRGHE